MTDYKALLSEVVAHIGLPALPENWSGVDVCLPLLEKMRGEGAVVLIKLDGARRGENSLPYTGVVSGEPLKKEEYFRTDAKSIEDCLAYIIVNYARHQWGFS
jgi:hypothetical protein